MEVILDSIGLKSKTLFLKKQFYITFVHFKYNYLRFNYNLIRVYFISRSIDYIIDYLIKYNYFTILQFIYNLTHIITHVFIKWR